MSIIQHAAQFIIRTAAITKAAYRYLLIVNMRRYRHIMDSFGRTTAGGYRRVVTNWSFHQLTTSCTRSVVLRCSFTTYCTTTVVIVSCLFYRRECYSTLDIRVNVAEHIRKLMTTREKQNTKAGNIR
jgi:hypothetical protein